MGRKALALVVCVGVFGGIHAVDALIRDRHIRELIENKESGAEAVAARYGASLDACGYDWGDPQHALMHAIFTAEHLATPYLSGQLRAAAVRFSGYVGLPPPDISVGIGRIRLSTARKYLSESAAPEASHYRSLSDQGLANALLDPCHAFRIGLTILERERAHYADRHKPSHALFIRHVARAYAGKSEIWTSVEAALSHEIYYRLVYNLFQIYRFDALSRCQSGLEVADQREWAEPHEPCRRSNPRGPFETKVGAVCPRPRPQSGTAPLRIL